MDMRGVTSRIMRPDGTPWIAAAVAFHMTPSRYTASEHIPSLPVITATTNSDGVLIPLDWEEGDPPGQPLYAPATYHVDIAGVMQFRITLLVGDGPITLEELHAASGSAGVPTDALQTLLDAALANYAPLVDLEAEATTRQSEDEALADDLATEVDARELADDTLADNLAAEILNRSNAVADLTADIATEEAAREFADSLNADAIADETSDRQAAIAGEATTRAADDATLQANISAEASARAAADTTLTTSLAAEATARAADDATIAGAISAEATARAAADTTLQENIDAEVVARAAAITTEASARGTADNAEAAARAAADATLTTNLAAEATTRASADTTLQTNIDAETTARAAAVTAEASTRSTADNTESTARAAADTTLQTNITAEATARAAADTTETNARIAADAAHVAAADPHTVYGLRAAMYAPQLVVGAYFNANIAATAASTVAANIGWLWLIPMLVGRACTLDRVRFECTIVGSADCVVALGLYAADSATGRPGARVASFGSVSNPAVATHEVTISQALAPGWYYAAMLGTGTTAPTVRCASTALPGILGHSTLTVNGFAAGLYVTGQTSIVSTMVGASFSIAAFVPTIGTRVGALS